MSKKNEVKTTESNDMIGIDAGAMTITTITPCTLANLSATCRRVHNGTLDAMVASMEILHGLLVKQIMWPDYLARTTNDPAEVTNDISLRISTVPNIWSRLTTLVDIPGFREFAVRYGTSTHKLRFLGAQFGSECQSWLRNKHGGIEKLQDIFRVFQVNCDNSEPINPDGSPILFEMEDGTTRPATINDERNEIIATIDKCYQQACEQKTQAKHNSQLTLEYFPLPTPPTPPTPATDTVKTDTGATDTVKTDTGATDTTTTTDNVTTDNVTTADTGAATRPMTLDDDTAIQHLLMPVRGNTAPVATLLRRIIRECIRLDVDKRNVYIGYIDSHLNKRDDLIAIARDAKKAKMAEAAKAAEKMESELSAQALKTPKIESSVKVVEPVKRGKPAKSMKTAENMKSTD